MSDRDISDLMYFSSLDAYKTVAQALSITEPLCQDWEWIVADEVSFEAAMVLYLKSGRDERHIVMEIMLQICADELDRSSTSVAFSNKWKQLEPLLLKSPNLHAYTVYYWSGFRKGDHEWKLLGTKIYKVWLTISPTL